MGKMVIAEQCAAHEQVSVKVNAFVDRGVAPLVEALNAINGVVTLESCERASYGHANWAVVLFTYGQDWHELAELVEALSAIIRAIDLGEAFSVRLEWLGSNDQPRGELLVPPGRVAEVAAAIQAALPLTRRTSRSTDRTQQASPAAQDVAAAAACGSSGPPGSSRELAPRTIARCEHRRIVLTRYAA